jgi:sigma-B regulation protein RsbU (phosphoserine phosphatase)
MEHHGLVLGIESKVPYAVHDATLEVGDRVVMYTDGLTEASNERGELFTVERLREKLLEHRYLNAQELASALFDEVRAYSGNDMRDDATILVLRLIGGELVRAPNPAQIASPT